MARGMPSGISLYMKDARIVLGMQARGDRNHDIAAWFGVNPGRIAEVKSGKFGELKAAPVSELPPSGPPGIKARRLKEAVARAVGILSEDAPRANERACALLKDALTRFDANE